jgi:hypothetical protein
MNLSALQVLTCTRYLNMDYVFLKSLPISELVFLIISYDIACQWHKNLWERMKIFPHEQVVLNNIKYIWFLIPKFHLPSHVEECNLAFSFNLTKGVGRTDGEAPERGWANINPYNMNPVYPPGGTSKGETKVK